MHKIYEYIQQLIDTKFYGKVELNFEAGKIVNLKETKSIKLLNE